MSVSGLNSAVILLCYNGLLYKFYLLDFVKQLIDCMIDNFFKSAPDEFN